MTSLFDQSLVQFRKFLSDQGYPDDIIWVAAEDALLSSTRLIYIKASAGDYNDTRVRGIFDLGITGANGILLAALCKFEDKTLCYAWVPADRAEAERSLMPEGVKFSVPVNPDRLHAGFVKSRLRWLYLRLKCRREQQLKNWLFS